PGRAVAASRATIEIGGQTLELPVPEGASSVRFSVELDEGPTELSARFHGADGETTGAYYAYVSRP
ncbi:MAG: N-acetylgalactosamine-4-sulfatase, partial [Planctomycetota bacterium]